MSDNQQQERKSRSARRRARYREIAAVLWEERLFDLFRGIGLENGLPGGTAVEQTLVTKEKELPLSVRVRHALERLGPVFIKLGQLLATRCALVPPALLEELAKLQDRVPEVDWPEMRTRIEAELGDSVEKLGVSEGLGLVQLAPRENPYLSGGGGYGGERPFSEETAKRIDAEVLKIIDESHEEAKRLLSAHRKQLDALAEALMEQEALDEQEILKATGLPRAPTLETRKLPVPGAESGSADPSRK